MNDAFKERLRFDFERHFMAKGVDLTRSCFDHDITFIRWRRTCGRGI